jgi:hypothetical protein
MSAAAVIPTPSLAALAASFHCPACTLHFRAPPSEMVPMLLACAHTICTACIEALSVVEPVYCPVCNAVTSGITQNFAMAEAAETVWTENTVETADIDVIMDRDAKRSKSDSDHYGDVADKLIPLLDRLAATSAALETGSEGMAVAKADLIAHVETSIARFHTLVDDVIEKANGYRATAVAVMRAVCDDRLKALEAQADELAVSAGQLAACVAAGKAAMARGNLESVKHAFDSALAMSELEKAVVQPRVPLRLEIAADAAPTLTALAGLARLRLYEVDAGKSSVYGDGLSWFAAGPPGLEDNVITVNCVDAGGMAADWLTASDIDVRVRGAGGVGVVGHVVSAAVIEAGIIEAVYAVDDEGCGVVELSVSVCGVILADGPWRAVGGGCKAMGVHVETFPIPTLEKTRGRAVAFDAMHMVVSDSDKNKLSVYCLSDVSRIRSFGKKGAEAGQFDEPFSLCMTDKNTVLVMEYGNERIQEVTLEGAHVKFIGAGIINDDMGLGLAVHGDVVAVGKSFGRLGRSDNRIMLFSYTSGAPLSQFGDWGSMDGQYRCVSAITFTSDGKYLAIYDQGNKRVTLTTVGGRFVKHYDAGQGGFNNVAFNNTGDIVVTDSYNHRVCVFSRDDGTLLRTWGAHNGEFKYPIALAVVRNWLYVLDEGNARVEVFE